MVSMRKHRSPLTRLPAVDLYMATPGYFDTMRIPRLAGRDFNHETASTTSVGIVNRAFAEYFFGRENPIGHRVTGEE